METGNDGGKDEPHDKGEIILPVRQLALLYMNKNVMDTFTTTTLIQSNQMLSTLYF